MALQREQELGDWLSDLDDEGWIIIEEGREEKPWEVEVENPDEFERLIKLSFKETGRSPEEAEARWQHEKQHLEKALEHQKEEDYKIFFYFSYAKDPKRGKMKTEHGLRFEGQIRVKSYKAILAHHDNPSAGDQTILGRR